MRNKAQEIVEMSGWMFPAIIASGWLSPLVYLINLIVEVISWL